MADTYSSDFGGVYNDQSGEYVDNKINTKAKTPTYRHAQKEAMQRGDSNTYFMRKSSKGKRSGKRGGK